MNSPPALSTPTWAIIGSWPDDHRHDAKPDWLAGCASGVVMDAGHFSAIGSLSAPAEILLYT